MNELDNTKRDAKTLRLAKESRPWREARRSSEHRVWHFRCIFKEH